MAVRTEIGERLLGRRRSGRRFGRMESDEGGVECGCGVGEQNPLRAAWRAR
jgi:hypothetical protein